MTRVRLGMMFRHSLLFAVALPLVSTMSAEPKRAAASQWVRVGAAGKLVYGHFKTGDRIADFSYAGYRGGGVALPVVPVKKSVAPGGADDTAAIQAAIDEVSALPLVQGVRGAVLLGKGHFRCSGTLKLAADGVVLRGSGGDTVLEMTGEPHLGIAVGSRSSIRAIGAPARVVDAYVPSGTQSLNVVDASGFAAGDRVEIVRPVTPEWLHLMGMDALARNGKKETWVSGKLTTERTVTTVAGRRLEFDVPLTDSYDAKFLGADGASVVKVEESGDITNVGVEDLRLVAPARKVTLSDKAFKGLQIDGTVDGWVHNVEMVDTTEAVGIGKSARRITVENVRVTQSVPIEGSAKPADFSLNGTQILVDRCSAVGDSVFYIATGPAMQGPNVVLHCVFHGNGHIQPHQRWSTGILIDGCQVPEGGIDLMNRGEMGSGHGWTMGWGVAWNNVAKSFTIQMPPGAANWSIGNRGEQLLSKMQTYGPGPMLPPLPQGLIESQGTPVAPESLYLQQLRDRLGEQAVRNIGYGEP